MLGAHVQTLYNKLLNSKGIAPFHGQTEWDKTFYSLNGGSFNLYLHQKKGSPDTEQI
jgi:hypothetical protein